MSFNASNNRISGWSYDASGNLLNDSVHNYTFDAENKIKSVDGNTAYTYDAEGQRVRKLVGENVRFVYGIGGKLVAEFDGATGVLKREYIYGASGLVATIVPNAQSGSGTQYTTSDGLGSPRVVTNSSAAVVSRHDYMPFGEELGAGIGGRTSGMGYGGADGLRKKFTGYERDSETGLDYAQARYFSSIQGRFTSADPLMASAKAVDPQSWNRYSYVGNNPTVFSDPSGMSRGPAPLYGSIHDTDRPPESRANHTLLEEAQAEWEVRLAETLAAIAEAEWLNELAKTDPDSALFLASGNPRLATEQSGSSPIIFTSVELLKLNEQNAEKLRSADFTEPVASAFSADLNVEEGTQVFDATNPANFTLRVNYKVAPHPDIAKVGEDSATRVVVPARGQFRHPTHSESYVPGGPQWYSYEVKGDRRGGTVYIRLRYTGQADALNYIRVTVSGSYQSGETFRSTASVHLTRNKK